MYRDYIVITNRKLCEGSFLQRLERVAQLGPKAILLREKDLTKEEYYALSLQVKEICDRYGILLWIHSYTDIAIKIKAYGVHNPLEAKADRKIKVSFACHSLDDVTRAEEKGANQIILGTIFETDCKPGKAGAGLGFLKEVCQATDLPVFAIGGIKPKDIKSVKKAGAAGACMMSYFMKV